MGNSPSSRSFPDVDTLRFEFSPFSNSVRKQPSLQGSHSTPVWHTSFSPTNNNANTRTPTVISITKSHSLTKSHSNRNIFGRRRSSVVMNKYGIRPIEHYRNRRDSLSNNPLQTIIAAQKSQRLPPTTKMSQLRPSLSQTDSNLGRHSEGSARKRPFFRRKLKDTKSADAMRFEDMKENHNSLNIGKQSTNGVSNIFLKETTINTAFEFWELHINTLSEQHYLQLSVLYFSYLLSDMPKTLTLYMSRHATLKDCSKQFLAMMGSVMVLLRRENCDVFEQLRRIGETHVSMGITESHFRIAIKALHSCLTEHFDRKYTCTIRYCIDRVFTVASRLMLDQITRLQFLTPNIGSEIQQVEFLKNFDACIQSSDGFIYLSRFLEIELCPEIVCFLDLYLTFSNAMGSDQRLVIAKRIVATCLTPDAPFEINVSSDQRKQCVSEVNRLNELHKAGHSKQLQVRESLFEVPFLEMKRLVIRNYWRRFVKSCESIQQSNQ